MGRTIAKECPRCGRMNFVDIDAEIFVCPGCQCRIEIDEQEKEETDCMMKKVVSQTTGKKKQQYEDSGKSPWGILLLCIILIGIGYALYNYKSWYKVSDPEAEDRERVNNNLTALLSYFSTKFKGEVKGVTYVVEYNLGLSAFTIDYSYEGKKGQYIYPVITYLTPDTLSFGNDDGTFELQQYLENTSSGVQIPRAKLKLVSFAKENKIFDAIGYSKIMLDKVDKD